jgi:hypothetical protein
VFRVTRSPASLPTFVNDVAEDIAGYVNALTLAHASGYTATHPLTALRAERRLSLRTSMSSHRAVIMSC